MKSAKYIDKRKVATVEKWNASGLSQAEFCRREGLEQWQLSEWKRHVARLKNQVDESSDLSDAHRQGREKSGRQNPRKRQTDVAVESETFLPVQLVETTVEGEDQPAGAFEFVLEVVLKRGQTIRVAPICQPQFLATVVSTLDI